MHTQKGIDVNNRTISATVLAVNSLLSSAAHADADRTACEVMMLDWTFNLKVVESIISTDAGTVITFREGRFVELPPPVQTFARECANLLSGGDSPEDWPLEPTEEREGI